MKKLDKLILLSFIPPFFLTFIVGVFILLNQHMLRYFDDLVGKNLELTVLAELFFYFSIFMIPLALPLAVLMSSLITFGNLADRFELVALKSSGISLVRTTLPIFIFVIGLIGVAFYTNNYFVPKAALKAYSLLYDIKRKKPSLDLREGIFYSAIPGVSIKVNHKFPDGQSLKEVIIYDHREGVGNKEVTVADSGRMHSMLNGRYLKLDLFKGYNYSENTYKNMNLNLQPATGPTMSKTKFETAHTIFDLSSFSMDRTDTKLFRGHRIMRNLLELQSDMDSLVRKITNQKEEAFSLLQTEFFKYNFTDFPKRSSALIRGGADAPMRQHEMIGKLPTVAKTDTKKNFDFLQEHSVATHDSVDLLSTSSKPGNLFGKEPNGKELEMALVHARDIKSKLTLHIEWLATYTNEFKIFQVQWHKILANSFACLAMFLIGAPLGTIIRKGGLGIPVLVSIFFFILFYVLGIMGEKWGKQGVVSVPEGVWLANTVLLAIGLFFLKQARSDARLFDTDFYHIVWDKVKQYFKDSKEHKIT